MTNIIPAFVYLILPRFWRCVYRTTFQRNVIKGRLGDLVGFIEPVIVLLVHVFSQVLTQRE